MSSLEYNKETALNQSKYKTYPEYKDSGVEWLSEIPEHWIVTPLKWTFELTPKKSELIGQQQQLECSFVPMEKLKTDSLVLDETRIVESVYDGYTYFADDDILIAKVTPCFENKNIAIAKKLMNGIGFGSSEIYVLRPNEKVYNRFLFYRLQENNFMVIATAAMTGAGGLKRVPSDIINSFTIALPNYPEQSQIANFLDHETAKIDTLIDKQQQLIKLLKEKRQAVISHAVTKGLNPEAPMKGSGVEWLGEVPEHWFVTPIKFVVNPCRGAVKAGPFGSHLKNTDMEGSDIKVISQKNVIGQDFDLGDSKISFQKYKELEVFTIKIDDILVTTRGTIGRTIVYNRVNTAILHPCLIRIQVDKSKIIPLLLALIIEESGYAMEQILINSNATTIEVIYSDNLINTMITLPVSIVEQQSLLDYIESEKACFDSLIFKANSAISLMEERRSALISAAVTGKIDVRHHALKDEQALHPSEMTMEVSA
jgi:type I restriction enzyme S subunit